MKRNAKNNVVALHPTSRKVSVRSICRGLILAGHSDEAITSYLVEHHNLPENHRHYAAWYRQEMVRNGELPAPVEASATA